jgi:hypothetical protein
VFYDRIWVSAFDRRCTRELSAILVCMLLCL